MNATDAASSDSSNVLNPKILRITALRLEDGKRVRVNVVLSDVIIRPDMELVLLDSREEEIARSLIMGVITTNLDFTLHVRDQSALPPFKVTGILKKDDEPLMESKTVDVT